MQTPFYEIVRRFQFSDDVPRIGLPHVHELRHMLAVLFAPYEIDFDLLECQAHSKE